MFPGVGGVVIVVIASVLQGLSPYWFIAFTLSVPLLVGQSVMLVPEPLGVPPPEYSHSYEVAPATG